MRRQRTSNRANAAPLNPGSPRAKSYGCSCSEVTNKDGEGLWTNPKGIKVWDYDEECPVHGAEAKRLIAKDEQVLEEDKQDGAVV